VALVARLEHLVTLALPVLLCQARDVGGLHRIHQRGRFAVWIQNRERLQDSGTVRGPLFVLRQGKANGDEAPRGTYFVVPALHVTGLAARRGSIGR
jgi:hypothetical protein